MATQVERIAQLESSTSIITKVVVLAATALMSFGVWVTVKVFDHEHRLKVLETLVSSMISAKFPDGVPIKTSGLGGPEKERLMKLFISGGYVPLNTSVSMSSSEAIYFIPASKNIQFDDSNAKVSSPNSTASGRPK